MSTSKMIPAARAARIAEDVRWALQCMKAPRVTLQRDHGHLLINFGDGKGRRLLIDRECTGDGLLIGHLTSALQHADPETLRELMRGYELARAAGLLEPAT